MNKNKARQNQMSRFRASSAKLLATSALTAAGLIALSAAPAFADNAWVLDQVGGSFNTDISINNVTNITQNTNTAIGQGNLDIGAIQTVNIHQGSNRDLFVARDNRIDPTRILGALNANGRVMVIDTNGIFFGADSTVNVGGIIASTADISNEAIMSGSDSFEFKNFGNGKIALEGTINVAEAGLAAFVSPTVTNNGVINAKMGKVVFAAGETVTLDLYGDGLVEIAVDGEIADALLETTGEINAEGGTVQMTAVAAKDAVDNIINVEGLVTVASAEVKGGKIILSGGDKGVVKVSGQLDASGVDGGQIEIDAQNTLVTAESTISADANTEEGQGGNIVLWGRENALYAGLISALGQNGFVETSGGRLGVWGQVNLSAGGEWLLDPTDITIVGGNNNTGLLGPLNADIFFSPNDANPGAVTANADSWVWIGDTGINQALDNGVNVTFQTFANGTRDGDITVRADANILKSAGAQSTLRFEAHDDIIIDGTIGTANGSILNVELVADYDASGNGGAGGNADILINNTVGTGGGNFTAIAPGDFTIAGAGFINADGGNISVDQAGIFNALTNTLNTAGVGMITLNQNVGGSINNAVLALNNTGTGLNTVNVGAGTYNENIVVSAQDNVALRGANAGISAKDGVRVAETIIDANIGNAGVYLNADNASIDGFQISGGLHGVEIYNAQNVSVLNNIIAGAGDNGIKVDVSNGALLSHNSIADSDDHGIEALDSNDLVVTNNAISRSGFSNPRASHGSGIRVNGGQNIRIGVDAFGVVGGNTIIDSNNDGIEIYNHSDAIIANNLISGIADDEGIEAYYAENILIDNNTITANLNEDAIELRFADGAVVTNNNISHLIASRYMRGSGVEVTFSDNVLIDSNQIDNTRDNAIRIVNNAGSNNSVTITNNIVTDTQGNGVYVRNGNDVQISGNTVTDADANGIYLEKVTSATVQSNLLQDTVERGIEVLSGDNVRIRRNIVTNAGADSIAVENANNILIDFNTLNNSGDDGIDLITVTDARIESNTINGSAVPRNGFDQNGIEISDSSNVRVTNANVINSVGKEGIEVSDSNNLLIDGNFINDPNSDGIIIREKTFDVTISNNVLDGNGAGDIHTTDEGIDFGAEGDISDVRILNNTITNFDHDGIEVALFDGFSVSDILIRGNTVENNAIHGIYILADASNIEITGNTIKDNGETGIRASAGYDGNKITNLLIADNTVTNNGNAGIEAWAPVGSNITNLEILRNTVTGNVSRGMFVAGKNSNVTINTNVISGNGLEGLLLYGYLYDDPLLGRVNQPMENVIVQDNTITNNGDAGIRMYSTDGVNISNNTIINNANFGVHMGGVNHGSIVFAGNTIRDHSVAARFESGQIDFTGDTNTIENTLGGTAVGFQFDENGATPSGHPFDSLTPPGTSGVLSIVGNTLGTTTFTGFTNPGSFYVRIENGTLLDTVTSAPIIIDAVDVSFDGFVPSAFGPILTRERFTFLEDRLFDADDAAINGRGQIFVGLSPDLENIEDFFNQFGEFAGGPNGLNVTLLGLPSVGFGTTAASLANIAPAAGGGDTSAESLANLEPAAGGEEATCWGDAVDTALAGTVVNFDFGGSFEESIADADACRTF